jgi:hypothetical protein
MVTECKDVFRLKLGAGPPANVNPLVIKLRDGAESVRMSARMYAPPQLEFMRDKIRELEKLDLVYTNTGAEWASPPLILSKPKPDQYHMTVDLRVPKRPQSRLHGRCLIFKTSYSTFMAQKFLRRRVFVKSIGRYLCTKIHKTVNRS